MEVPTNAGRLRFGLFEIDVSARELHKRGQKIPLQDHPFQILALLLERPGEVVTREALRKALWPADTFVDFDEGLNTAIKKLRYGLGDSPDNPTFIETVPRHGYRFIAPVTHAEVARDPGNGGPQHARTLAGKGPLPLVSEGGESSFAAAISIAPNNGTPTGEELRQTISVAHAAPPHTPGRRRGWFLFASGFALVVLTAIIALRLRPKPEPRLLGAIQITQDSRIKTRIVTDGVRLYFSEIRGGYRREWQADVGSETGYIGQVSVAGGETSYISTPFTNVAVFDISRDGSQLLVGEWTGTEEEARIWIMPLPSGSPQRVGTVLAHDGTFSPDGQRLVYANGSALLTAKLDGSGVLQLASVPGSPFQPRFSPDGRQLRFSVADTNTQWTSIWEIDFHGKLHPFFAKSQIVDQQCCGTWSRDGKYFFFSRNTSHGWSDIWLFDEQMTRPRQLTTGPLGFFSPVASADGKELFVIGSHPRSELVRYDLKMHQFVFNLSGMSADQVEYSRDGNWVTYVAFPEGTLWRSKSDGSEKLQLTSRPMTVTLPTWSPDGKQIAFAAARPGTPWKLFLVSADKGGTVEELLPNEHRDEMDPTWSPDGTTLAFGRRPGETDKFGEVEIMLLNLRTRHLEALPGSRGLVGPRWAPQGRYLSAMTTDSQKIALFDFRTGRWTVLVIGGFAYQNWSKDGKYIYFDSLFQRNKELLRMRIPGGQVEHLASLKGFEVGVGDAGAWNSVTPDGSPMLMRNIGTSEIYRLDVVLP